MADKTNSTEQHYTTPKKNDVTCVIEDGHIKQIFAVDNYTGRVVHLDDCKTLLANFMHANAIESQLRAEQGILATQLSYIPDQYLQTAGGALLSEHDKLKQMADNIKNAGDSHINMVKLVADRAIAGLDENIGHGVPVMAKAQTSAKTII